MKYPFFSAKFFRNFLIIVLIFNALSALAGGLGLIFLNGLGMPAEWVSVLGSSYVIPGLILFFIVGGTNLLAAISIIKKWIYAMEAAMVAGFGMQIWIYTEIYLIKQASWLQTLYFGTGTLVLILAFLLFGRLKEKEV